MKQQQTKLVNLQSPEHVGNFKQHITNYFKLKEDLVSSTFEEQDLLYPHKGEVFRRLPLPKINQHFHHNTIE